MKIKAKLVENKKVIFEGNGAEALRKIDEMLKR
jgi:hypothetical protein